MSLKKIIFVATGILFVPLALSALELQPVEVQTSAAKATATTNTVSEAYNNAKTIYQKAKNDYATAKSSYLNAKNAYQKAKNQENLDSLLTAAKDYLTRAIDTSIKYLETLKSQVESLTGIEEATKTNILNEINADLDWLSAKKTEVTSAQDKDDLIAIMETVKNYWNDIKVKVKKNVGEVLASRINIVLVKLEAAGDKVQENINKLKENGQDAADLESLLAKYNEHLTNAKADWEQAKNKFNAITTLADADTLFSQGKEYLKSANRNIRYAYNQLQDIKTALKSKKLNKVDLGGTGSLHAEGKGIAELDGKGSVIASTDSAGTVTVVDLDGDVKVDVEGTGQVETIDEQTKQYSGYGKIIVNGTDINVNVQGSALSIDAAGTGTASMFGEGTYYVGPQGNPKPIPVGGIMVTLTNTATSDSSTAVNSNN